MTKQLYLSTYDHGGYILWNGDFRARLESGEAWLRKYPKFKLGLDNESFAYDIFDEISPEINEKIREMLKNYKGRFGIGSTTYGQPLSVFISNESNVRQLTYAIRANLKHFGTTPEVYAISEHALHGQIPQLALSCGYKAALMRTHFMMYGYNPTYDSPWGLWYGDDGSAIPTVPTYEGEGNEFGITTLDNWILTRWPDQTDKSPEMFLEKFNKIEPLLATRYDDITLRCEGLPAFAETKENYHWILLEEIFGLYGEPKDEYRPDPTEFVVRMPWGYCGNEIWNGCREAENRVQLAETLDAFTWMLGGESDGERLERAWKNLMVAQHHDVQICGLLTDSRKYIPASLAASDEVISGAEKQIGSKLSGGENMLAAVNINSFETEALLELECVLERSKGAPGFVVCSGDERIIPEVLPVEYRSNGKITRAILRFPAKLKPYSAKVYRAVPAYDGEPCEPECRIEVDGLKIRTPYADIALSDKGGIASIVSRGREVVRSAEGTLIAGVIDGVDCRSVGTWHIINGKNMVEAISRGMIGSIPYSFTLKFYAHTPRIDCEAVFTHNGERIGSVAPSTDFKLNFNGFVHENKLRFLLETPLAGVGRADRPFMDIVTDDKYVQGLTWAAVCEDEAGLAVFNKGSMCLTREPGAVSVPLAYANDYIWGRRMLWGEYRHQFALWPMGAFDPSELNREARKYQTPPHTFAPSDREGGAEEIIFLRPEYSDSASGSAVLVEDGRLRVRVYEDAGKTASAAIKSDFAVLAGECDLMNNPIGGADSSLSPRRIKTYILERK